MEEEKAMEEELPTAIVGLPVSPEKKLTAVRKNVVVKLQELWDHFAFPPIVLEEAKQLFAKANDIKPCIRPLEVAGVASFLITARQNFSRKVIAKQITLQQLDAISNVNMPRIVQAVNHIESQILTVTEKEDSRKGSVYGCSGNYPFPGFQTFYDPFTNDDVSAQVINLANETLRAVQKITMEAIEPNVYTVAAVYFAYLSFYYQNRGGVVFKSKQPPPSLPNLVGRVTSFKGSLLKKNGDISNALLNAVAVIQEELKRLTRDMVGLVGRPVEPMKKKQIVEFISKNLVAILRNVDDYSCRVISEIESELQNKITHVFEVPEELTDEEKAAFLMPELTDKDLLDQSVSFYQLDINERQQKEEHLENVILHYREKKEQRLHRGGNQLSDGEGVDYEADYIEKEPVATPNLEIVPHITNVVSICEFGCPIDLSEVALGIRGAELHVKPVMVSMKVSSITAKLYESGKMSVTGARSEREALKGSRMIAYLVKWIVEPKVEFVNFKITNMTGSFGLNFIVDIEKLAYSHWDVVRYNPESFRAAYYCMTYPRVTVTVFPKGEIIITGAKNRRDVTLAANLIHPILKDMKKTGLTN